MREEGTGSKYKSLYITLPLCQTTHTTLSLLNVPYSNFFTLLSPLNLTFSTTQHHILSSLPAKMHFIQAIVSFTLMVGCMALAFPSYDFLHLRSDPNPPAKFAHRAEIAPRADLAPRPALPPRSGVAPRGSDVAPRADHGPLNGLVDRARLVPRGEGDTVITVTGNNNNIKVIKKTKKKNETVEAQGPLTFQFGQSSLQVSDGDNLLWTVRTIHTSDSNCRVAQLTVFTRSR